MAVSFDAVLNLSKAGLIDPKQMGYEDSLEIIKDESVKIQKSFVKIGWYLKHIKDDELYKEGGYASINECAADKLGYSQSTVSRLINICEKFSKNHNSPELDDRYAGFDKSQMIEMLPMEPEQLEKVKPDMTVKQIRDIKDSGKTGSDDTEESDEDSTIPGQTSIERDLPEYMPSGPMISDDYEEEDENQKYAMSHTDETVMEGEEDIVDEEVVEGEYREVGTPVPESAVVADIAMSQSDCEVHDEKWFVGQYVKFVPQESAELMEICRREKSNSDRAKSIQERIAPYGHHGRSCDKYDFTFHGFAKGIDFRVGCDEIHLTYRRFAQELLQMAEDGPATSQSEKSAYGLEDIREKEETAAETQQELPVLKNNDQRKQWLNNYKAWGLWYRDENIGVNYYKFDFSEGSRLVVVEYPQRFEYYSGDRRDEYFYHLLEKNKKGYKKVYDEEYRHQADSETYLVEFLKAIQKEVSLCMG